MDYNSLEKYLLSKKGSVKEFPFDKTTAVFKVMNKMFALISTEVDPLRMNLKCEPSDVEILRSMFKSVIPGFHMNKKHWNSVIMDGTVPKDDLTRMIDDSYKLVVQGLKKTDKLKLDES